MGESPRPVFQKTNISKSIMGLRFSILGFAQERAVDVVAFKDGKEVRLDVIDLLLLNQIADFPNRSHVMKIIEGEKIFFWIAYTEILGELPILRLKKQALRDRFDKLVLLGLLEKRHNKTNNMTFFRLTDMYETLKYDTMVYDTDRGCVVNDRGVYSDTQGVCSELHTISVNKYNKNNKEKEYKEKENGTSSDKDSAGGVLDALDKPTITMPTPAEHTISYRTDEPTKEELNGLFEELWMMYERKGSKANAKKEFAKLTEEEIETMRMHIPAYLQARPERQYRQDFERYIKHKTFNSVVYSKQNEMLFDPEAKNASATKPTEFNANNESVTFNGTIYR